MRKIKDFWELLSSLEEKGEKLAIFSSFGDSDFLDEEVDFVWDIILKEHGIDISNDLIAEKAYDTLCDFTDGQITQKQAKAKLNKLSKN